MLPFFHSVPWVHVVPALFAVISGFFYLKTQWIYMKVVWSILWLLLLPNTAYIFTDVTRISLHWTSSSSILRITLIIQYLLLEVIGLTTFLLAMLPFENMVHVKRLSQRGQILAIILLNFLIGFGIVLGRTGYTNSYVIFTQPAKVLLAAVTIVTSLNLLGLTIAFGILCTYIYVLFRNLLLHYSKKFL